MVIASGFTAELVAFMAGPVAETLASLTATFLSIIALDLVVVAVLSLIEFAVRRLTGLSVEYQDAAGPVEPVDEVGPEILPMPRSITEVPLPVPPPPPGARLPESERPHPPAPPVDDSSSG